jgi:hypothetical protein
LLIKATLLWKLAGMTNIEKQKNLPQIKIHTKILAVMHIRLFFRSGERVLPQAITSSVLALDLLPALVDK